VRPVKELKDYCRLSLAAGEEREIRFSLPKASLGFYDNEGKYRLEDGLFRVFVGGSSREVQEIEIALSFS
jgi:beta-glucosidase